MFQQLRVLTLVEGSSPRLYSGRWVYGHARRSSRAIVTADGVSVPAGGTSFRVPRGTVPVGSVVLFAGQYFRATGTQPADVFLTRDDVETDQASGRFNEQPPTTYPLAAEGFTLVADGYTMVSR